MCDRKIPVYIGELAVSKGDDMLVAPNLGSCIGVALYDSETRIGGLAHILLDYGYLYGEPDPKLPGKYADTAIPELLRRMVSLGASRERITARIVGGGNMFGELFPAPLFDPGSRNTEAAKEVLCRLSIPLIAEDIGGYNPRTLEFRLSSGELVARYKRGEERVL